MAARKAASKPVKVTPLKKKPLVIKKKTTGSKSAALHMPRVINLALQGGGSHGAYTWGALEALLDEPRLVIEGISGASAGAMNAVILAAGMTKGGAQGAKDELEAFWRDVSRQNALSPLQRAPMDVLLGNWSFASSPTYMGYDLFSRVFSPYQTNPLDINPLRDTIAEMVDFKALRQQDSLKVFVSATNVRTGRGRVFTRKELTPNVLAASSCLPQLFQAVKIGREYYWDGGYMGNPPLWPLIYKCDSRDIVLIQISPMTRDGLPKTPIEINERANEIMFNSSLLHELRAIRFVTRLLDNGKLDPTQYKKMLMHRIHSEEVFDRYDTTSKINTEWKFLQVLRRAGHAAGERWLRRSFNQIGVESSYDIMGKTI